MSGFVIFLLGFVLGGFAIVAGIFLIQMVFGFGGWR
jgi:hypothetical protein